MQSKLIFGALFGIFLTSTFDHNSSHQDAIIFRMTNAVCESYNQSWFVFHTCRLKALSRSKVVFNMNGTILHPVNDITIRVRVFKRASGYKPWLFNIYFDACQYLRKPNVPFVKLVYGLFKEFSNINHSCPYVGLQIIKGFYPKTELFPLPFPSGDYMLTGQWYFDKKPQFDTNISFAFVEDLLKNN
ncbi:uncharacterized protein LOC117889734 [Drosophila subobscura]|uniref:uncharacterized protein LOC117889734 n=1 Tax=Drosophila subobscura TaxID=7241 RepID=UPI00155B3A4D|nr:uncharacterized protein LOC117889734 [Drosophila subobscura]